MNGRTKNRNPVHTIAVAVAAILIGAAALYVGVQLYSILNNTYQTETAIEYTMADSIYLDGAAAFEAQDVEGSGNLGYLVEDGERVTANTVLAERYTSDSQAVLRERLNTLQTQITLLEKSQNSTGSDLSVLTGQAASALYDLLDRLDTRSYDDVQQAGQEFLLAQNRLQISTGQASDFSATLAALRSEYDAAAAQLGGLETITAQTNGYFVCAENAGYLTVSPETLENATASELQAILQAGAWAEPEGMAGRIITSFSWKFYAVCTAEEAARFKEVSSVKLSVPGVVDDPLTAKVVDVSMDGNGELAKVTLECQTINAKVLGLGQVRARVDLKTYQGIRIDKKALHIVNGQNGVYVKYGNLQRFRKITKLYEDENYILVPEDGKVGTDNEVRLYDEIIVEGNNLQDGKLM